MPVLGGGSSFKKSLHADSHLYQLPSCAHPELITRKGPFPPRVPTGRSESLSWDGAVAALFEPLGPGELKVEGPALSLPAHLACGRVLNQEGQGRICVSVRK